VLEIASKSQLRWAFLRGAAIFVPLILFLGNLSGRVGKSAIQNGWYDALLKPGITPPNIYFPITWGILYLLMGFAIAMVWFAKGNRYRMIGFILFAIQIALNFAWTPAFFGAQSPLYGLLVIGALLIAISATTHIFFKIRFWAGMLMLPCVLWIFFATYLNAQIWRLNPDGVVVTAPSTTTTQPTRQSPGLVPL
jgi:translocator protein